MFTDASSPIACRLIPSSRAYSGSANVTRPNDSRALAVGRALGLGQFGRDVIESDDGPVVVDVNYFPGYKGVPDAGAMIADYIDRYARRLADGAGPPAGRIAVEGPGVPAGL